MVLYRDQVMIIFQWESSGEFNHYSNPANPSPKPIIPLHITLSPHLNHSLLSSQRATHPLILSSLLVSSPSLLSSRSADRSERSTGVTLGWALIVHVNAAREGWRDRKRDGDGYCTLKSANSGPGPAPPRFSPTSKLSKHTPPEVSPLILTHTPLLHPWFPHTAAPRPLNTREAAWWTP